MPQSKRIDSGLYLPYNTRTIPSAKKPWGGTCFAKFDKDLHLVLTIGSRRLETPPLVHAKHVSGISTLVENITTLLNH